MAFPCYLLAIGRGKQLIVIDYQMVDLMILITDPNAHILWPENVDARVKALCDIEAGLFSVSSLVGDYNI